MILMDCRPFRSGSWGPTGPTYKSYVSLQSDTETKAHGVLETHAAAGTDAVLAAASVAPLGRPFTRSRYLCDGFQRIGGCIGYTASRPYIANAAGFWTAGFPRRVTTIAYRSGELSIARPGSGVGSAERSAGQERVTDTGTAQAA